MVEKANKNAAFIRLSRGGNVKHVKNSTDLSASVNLKFHNALQLRYSKPLIETVSVVAAGRGVIAWKTDDRRKCL